MRMAAYTVAVAAMSWPIRRLDRRLVAGARRNAATALTADRMRAWAWDQMGNEVTGLAATHRRSA
jgi:hypothetical protein